MLWTLFFLIIILLLLSRGGSAGPSKPSNPSLPSDVTRATEQLNADWVKFILSYKKVAQSKSDKNIIKQMLDDLRRQGLHIDESTSGTVVRVAAATDRPAFTTIPAVPPKQPVQLDNVSILLYFGAFLFVASVGLFVAFSGLSGVLRTSAVALVALIMYGAGLWLHANKPKLEQAGLAFVGIGLASAPFVGLAAYSFIFDQTHGSAVWFATSVGCMAMYLHALLRLRKPLLSYLLIFTMLSLVESGVSIASAPIFYFSLGLAATGLILSVMSHYKGFDQPLQDASSNSSKIFVPLAVLASAILAGSEGTWQLGASLLLAAGYYASEFWYGKPIERAGNAIAAQVAAVAAVTDLAYSIRDDFQWAVLALVMCNILQLVVLMARGRMGSKLWTNFSSIILVGGALAAVVAVDDTRTLFASVASLALTSLVIWRMQARPEAYMIGMLAWMLLSVVIGQRLISPALTISQQVMLSGAFLLMQWLVAFPARPNASPLQANAIDIMYILSSGGVVWAALAASPSVAFGVCLAVAASMVGFAERLRSRDWAAVAGIVAAAPLIVTHDDDKLFLLTLCLALLANVALALRYRSEFTRWLSTGLWLLLPFACGNGGLGHWSVTEYAWAYLVSMLGLVLSRAVARGVVFMSSKAPLDSFTRSASSSYVVGYVLAGAIAIGASLFTDNSRLHTSIILGAIGLVVWLLAVRIEKRHELLTLLPLIAQGLLLSILRIDSDDHAFDVYLLASTLLASVWYAALLPIIVGTKSSSIAAISMRDGAMFAALVTPLSFAVAGQTKMMMPIGLLVFGVMVYDRVRYSSQANREWAGVIGLLAVWWFMDYLGVTNIQAYAHVLAALFAGYAYWRSRRSETAVVDQYLLAMLATATVPLVLQALFGTAGDLYGWWLLLEQVLFMLLGMSINKSFVTRWGLYVALGAVLYQLRNLGWAALTVLALFLIGLAIYRLQNQDKK